MKNLSPETAAKFALYEQILRKWQKAINLVGTDTLDDIKTRHIADSAQLSDFIPSLSAPPLSSRQKPGSGSSFATMETIKPESALDPGFRRDDKNEDENEKKGEAIQKTILFDLGSGAGFPGLALAMMRPDLDVHLIESDERKGAFLKTVSRETETPATVHICRAEALDPAALPCPHIITARALAPLKTLLDYAAPFVALNPDIKLLFLKGKTAEQEIADARKAWDFDIEIHPSKAGDGSVLLIQNLRRAVQK
jgi:16S rRNA (guanine527-N7)-methyltransferase